MANFREAHAAMRESEPRRSGGGSSAHIYMALIAVLGFGIGAAAVLFVPTLSSQAPTTPHTVSIESAAPQQQPAPRTSAEAAAAPSAAPPTLEGMRDRVARGESIEQPSLAPLKPASINYAADPEKLAKASDEVCFQRSLARFPNNAKRARLSGLADDFHITEMKHYHELMSCLLVESPARYCSASERSMIATEIISYFRGIALLNKQLDQVRRLEAMRTVDRIDVPVQEPDPAVIAGITARLRDGVFGKEDFDKFKGSMPERLRNQLAAVPRGLSQCPAKPWWAVWR
jgi:hypothetical protein